MYRCIADPTARMHLLKKGIRNLILFEILIDKSTSFGKTIECFGFNNTSSNVSASFIFSLIFILTAILFRV